MPVRHAQATFTTRLSEELKLFFFTKRLLHTAIDDAHPGFAENHDAKRHEPPVERERSSGSEVKRSSTEDEAIRRADAEAGKALKRAREMKERRAAKRASVQELEESMDTETDGSMQQRGCIGGGSRSCTCRNA